MTDLVKRFHDKVQTKLIRHKSNHWSKLPAELQHRIIQYAIPDFLPTIDIAYKNKCGESLDKKPLRWKVTGIPKVALNLQLVNHKIQLQAREHMMKACIGTRSPMYPLRYCLGESNYRHTGAMGRLRYPFGRFEIGHLYWTVDWELDLWTMFRAMKNQISFQGWTHILMIFSDLYFSDHSRAWSVTAVVERVEVKVIERWGTIDWAWRYTRSKEFFAKLMLNIELNVRFSAPNQIKIDMNKTPPVLAKFVGKKQLKAEGSLPGDDVKRNLLQLKNKVRRLKD